MKVIDAHNSGEGYKKVAKCYHISCSGSTVQNVIKRWQFRAAVEVKMSSGRLKKTWRELLVRWSERQLKSAV